MLGLSSKEAPLLGKRELISPGQERVEIFYSRQSLLDALQLSPTLFASLSIVAAWEGWTVEEMCRKNLVSLLESEFGEMLAIADNESRDEQEREWVKGYVSALAPLMQSLGWNGSAITSEEEAG